MVHNAEDRIGFIQWILGDDAGYISVCSKVARTGEWQEVFYQYPRDVTKVSNDIETKRLTSDVYFCPTVLAEPKRVKKNVKYSNVIWADLDDCPPDKVLLPPTVVIETSPERWQAYWVLNEKVHALDAEDINRRIAYYHEDEGADISGWDLTQLLRVPFTSNHKRKIDILSPSPDIRVVEANSDITYDLEDFFIYPEVEGHIRFTDPVPTVQQLPNKTADEILTRIRASLTPSAWSLFAEVPKDHRWSHNIWSLEQQLFAAGCTPEEVFVVVKEAACNKYDRDGRPDQLLWKEILRAQEHANDPRYAAAESDEDAPDWHFPDKSLLTVSERESAKKRHTIIEEYIDWATSVGDAAPEFHEAGAFIILSALLSGSLQLPTSFGKVVPNLWFQILAGTTLSRKTSSMDMATDVLEEVNPDSLLATDGSIEGMMTALSMRPGRPSVFLRDEFSGMLEQVEKRDYYAGMLEALTKLYDGKLQKKVLRKEIIEVRKPRLILYTGGIKERIFSLISAGHIDSGFLPRFCFITADANLDKLKPLGPPTEKNIEERDELIQRFRDIFNHYNVPTVPGPEAEDPNIVVFEKTWDAQMTREAWIRYNQIESLMQHIGVDSSSPDLITPMMTRLCTSGLKAALLLAAADRLEDKVVIQESDIVQAFYYVEGWKRHTFKVIMNAGKSSTERELERIALFVQDHPGCSRSKVMTHFRLKAREADNIFATLEQRGMVRAEKRGKGGRAGGEHFFPMKTTKPTKEKKDL